MPELPANFVPEPFTDCEISFNDGRSQVKFIESGSDAMVLRTTKRFGHGRHEVELLREFL